MHEVDDPGRGEQLRQLIQRKPALRMFYQGVYDRYREVMSRCPTDGLAVELGAGAGFAKQSIPELTTADVLPYSMVDLVFDARRMPFADESVRFLSLLNVFHHIPDVAAFLAECQRCLKPGGRLLIVDQYPGWLSHWILAYAHHEPFDPDAKDWSFRSTGALSGANGALAWIVFHRDRLRFEYDFPELQIESLKPHTPLLYWLSGGLKQWSLIPTFAVRCVARLDSLLIRLSPRWGSFIDVEIVRLP